MKSIWKSKRFLIGFTYLFILVSASFIYSWFFKDTIPKAPQLLYNDNNELLERLLSTIINTAFWIGSFWRVCFLTNYRRSKVHHFISRSN